MKVAGVMLAVLGGLLILSGLRLAVTKYDPNSTHDMNKLVGGLCISALILAAGIAMIVKSKPDA